MQNRFPKMAEPNNSVPGIKHCFLSGTTWQHENAHVWKGEITVLGMILTSLHVRKELFSALTAKTGICGRFNSRFRDLATAGWEPFETI